MGKLTKSLELFFPVDLEFLLLNCALDSHWKSDLLAQGEDLAGVFVDLKWIFLETESQLSLEGGLHVFDELLHPDFDFFFDFDFGYFHRLFVQGTYFDDVIVLNDHGMYPREELL